MPFDAIEYINTPRWLTSRLGLAAERLCALTLFTSTTKNVRRAGGGTLCVFCFRQ